MHRHITNRSPFIGCTLFMRNHIKNLQITLYNAREDCKITQTSIHHNTTCQYPYQTQNRFVNYKKVRKRNLRLYSLALVRISINRDTSLNLIERKKKQKKKTPFSHIFSHHISPQQIYFPGKM